MIHIGLFFSVDKIRHIYDILLNVGKYKIYLNELQKHEEKRASGEYNVFFIFPNKVRILCS